MAPSIGQLDIICSSLFQVWRKVQVYMTYKLVGQTSYTVTSAGVQNARAASPIAVRDGDVLGFFFPSQSIIPYNNYVCAHEQSCVLYVKNPNFIFLNIGTQRRFSSKLHSLHPCRNYSLNAVISGAGRYHSSYINLLKGRVRNCSSCWVFVLKAGVSR